MEDSESDSISFDDEHVISTAIDIQPTNFTKSEYSIANLPSDEVAP